MEKSQVWWHMVVNPELGTYQAYWSLPQSDSWGYSNLQVPFKNRFMFKKKKIKTKKDDRAWEKTPMVVCQSLYAWTASTCTCMCTHLQISEHTHIHIDTHTQRVKNRLWGIEKRKLKPNTKNALYDNILKIQIDKKIVISNFKLVACFRFSPFHHPHRKV